MVVRAARARFALYVLRKLELTDGRGIEDFAASVANTVLWGSRDLSRRSGRGQAYTTEVSSIAAH